MNLKRRSLPMLALLAVLLTCPHGWYQCLIRLFDLG